jgi:predicted amidophosphoribosyltransferase
MPVMLICSNCHKENQEDSKFCQECGCSLEVQSNIVKIGKPTGVSKFTPLSREERFRRAKIAALKALKNAEAVESAPQGVVVIGKKIL